MGPARDATGSRRFEPYLLHHTLTPERNAPGSLLTGAERCILEPMGKKKGKDNSAAPSPELENLEKTQGNQEAGDTKGTHGGAREGAGRKPLADRKKVQELRDLIEDHAGEEVEIVETNRGTGTTQVKKKKTIVAIMDMLRHEAIQNKSIPAAKEYLDRVLGKAIQPLEHSGEIDTETQGIPNHPAVVAAREAFYATLREQRN